jgi:hypothetical protein
MDVALACLLLENQIAISMEANGVRRDNVFVERIGRSVKYGGLSSGLPQCRRGAHLDGPVSGGLQPQAFAFEPWRRRPASRRKTAAIPIIKGETLFRQSRPRLNNAVALGFIATHRANCDLALCRCDPLPDVVWRIRRVGCLKWAAWGSMIRLQIFICRTAKLT